MVIWSLNLDTLVPAGPSAPGAVCLIAASLQAGAVIYTARTTSATLQAAASMQAGRPSSTQAGASTQAASSISAALSPPAVAQAGLTLPSAASLQRGALLATAPGTGVSAIASQQASVPSQSQPGLFAASTANFLEEAPQTSLLGASMEADLAFTAADAPATVEGALLQAQLALLPSAVTQAPQRPPEAQRRYHAAAPKRTYHAAAPKACEATYP